MTALTVVDTFVLILNQGAANAYILYAQMHIWSTLLVILGLHPPLASPALVQAALEENAPVSVYDAQRFVLGAQHVCDVGELGEFALKVLDVGLLALAALVGQKVEGEGWGWGWG